MPFDQGGGSFAPVNAYTGVVPDMAGAAQAIGIGQGQQAIAARPRGGGGGGGGGGKQQLNPFHSAISSMLAQPKPTPPPPPPAPHDPLGILDILSGKQNPQDPLQALKNATTGIFNNIPNAKPGGPNAQNIPNAQPGQLQTQPDAQAPLDPSKIQSEGDFAKALLDNLGVPSTPGMINALTGWEHKEEGSWSGTPTPDRFNPLNTGLSEPGAVNNNLGGGTIAYPNWNEGVQATADTIRQGNMAPILRALQSGDPSQLGRAVSQTPWAEAGYTWDSTQPVGGDSNVTAANAKGNFPKGQEPGAPAQATQSGSGAGGGGGGGGGSQQASGGGGGPSPVGPQAAQVAQQIPLMAMALSQPNQSFDPLSILLASANSEPGQSNQDQQDALGIMTGDNG